MSSLRTFSPCSLCAIAIVLSSSLHLVASVCRESDKAALLRIKSSLGYSSRMATWNNSTDCCYYWYGVGCDNPTSTGKVIFLWITESNTSGPLPSCIGDLPDLTHLEIANHPNLTGPIPKSITKLRNLDYLAITGTALSGKIQRFLCKMTNISTLDLSNNSLSGKIPGCFKGRVHVINLSQNRLSGHLPASLFKSYMGTDISFNVRGNQLSGKIPQSFKTINFLDLDLSDNQFHGDASVVFGESKVADYILLSNNKFDFDLSSLTYPLYMSWLNISHNKIRGSINPQITKLQRVGGMDMSYNRLCGPVPSGMSAYDKSVFAHNKCLCGNPLPPCDS